MKKNLKISFSGQPPIEIASSLLATPAYQSFLLTKSHQPVLCHCTNPPVQMNISKSQNGGYLRSNPGQAIRHTVDCPLFPAKDMLNYAKHVCESFIEGPGLSSTHLFEPPPFSGVAPQRMMADSPTPINGLVFVYGLTKRIDVLNSNAVLRLKDATKAYIEWTTESLTPLDWSSKQVKTLIGKRFAGLLKRSSQKHYSVIAGYLED